MLQITIVIVLGAYSMVGFWCLLRFWWVEIYIPACDLQFTVRRIVYLVIMFVIALFLWWFPFISDKPDMGSWYHSRTVRCT